jgi:glycosyltransferase involved in cell wall biosynthesis
LLLRHHYRGTGDQITSGMQTVSVIIPTRALRERSALLRRAVESVLAQRAVHVVPLVIVNGACKDRAVTDELRADRRLRVATLDDANLPAALLVGREMVDTPWFAELDDDDIFFPEALSLRIRALEERPEFDAVVTNGLRRDPTGDRLHIDDILSVERDPVRALLQANWLLPGSWLCRTDSIGAHIFNAMPRFLECTYLALRLAIDYRVRFLDCPTVVYHVDTPLSESNSLDYRLGQAAAFRRLLELDLPQDVRARFRTRLRRACHANAKFYLDEGSVTKGWCWHLESLQEPGGWRYLPYTARLLYAGLAR